MFTSLKGFFTELKRVGLANVIGRYYSFYPAVVIDNNDPENRGRLKVKCFLFEGDENRDGNLDVWIPGKGIISGENTGVFWIPEINDNINIEFREGHKSFPYWSYGNFRKGKNPSEIGNYLIITPKGLSISLNDNDENIILSNKEGYKITIEKTGIDFEKDGTSVGKILQDMNKSISVLTVPTAFGPSGVPVNATDFTNFIVELKKVFK